MDHRTLIGRALIVAVALTALAGCSMFSKKEAPPCPNISVLADAGKFTQFRPGQGRDITDIVLQGEITGFKGSCSYDKDKKQMTVALKVEMNFTLGPAAPARAAKAAYFIAIPAYYPNPSAKRIFPISFDFETASDRIHFTDGEVDVLLPMKDFAKDIDKSEVYLGFQLDQAELDYNRQTSNKR